MNDIFDVPKDDYLQSQLLQLSKQLVNWEGRMKIVLDKHGPRKFTCVYPHRNLLEDVVWL